MQTRKQKKALARRKRIEKKRNTEGLYFRDSESIKKDITFELHHKKVVDIDPNLEKPNLRESPSYNYWNKYREMKKLLIEETA